MFHRTIAEKIKTMGCDFGEIVVVSSISGPGSTNSYCGNRINNSWTVLKKNMISLGMDSGIRTIYSHSLNRGFSSKYPESYSDWQTLETLAKMLWQ